jgi:hypothetical protein
LATASTVNRQNIAWLTKSNASIVDTIGHEAIHPPSIPWSQHGILSYSQVSIDINDKRLVATRQTRFHSSSPLRTSQPNANMCVAGLNVSTRPCHHRWYELIRTCSSSHNLSNCPSKLQLEGWEQRKEGCPWCDSSGGSDNTTYRLFGSTSSASGSTSSSPVISAMGKPQLKRCDTDSTLSSLTRTGSFSTTGSEQRGQRHREMNDRFHLYLTTLPHEVLPSAKKNYPGYETERPLSPDCGSIKSSRKLFGAGWRKSVRFGRSMFAS